MQVVIRVAGCRFAVERNLDGLTGIGAQVNQHLFADSGASYSVEHILRTGIVPLAKDRPRRTVVRRSQDNEPVVRTALSRCCQGTGISRQRHIEAQLYIVH